FAKGRGFWDGGGSGHGTNKESSGRTSGFPGSRKPKRAGFNTDLEFPLDDQEGQSGSGPSSKL
ncbi:MAG TPA: hypothetical protein VFT12_02805, partial [Thermoanaerobaculia bacterium]|nr:hypothetical protein [Thermoanaerobaculia bacterium]